MHFSSVICPLKKPSLACEGNSIDVRPLKKFFLFIYLFIFLTVLSLRCRTGAFSRCGERGLFLVAVSGLLISQGLFLLQTQALGPVGFGRCSTWVQLSLCGTWDLPRPGVEPMSRASTGGFLTTGPVGKS